MENDDQLAWPDEDAPLLSASRIWRAVKWYVWYDYQVDGNHSIGFWFMVRFYHRPFAARQHY